MSAQPAKPPLQLLDASGKDVTPRSLVNPAKKRTLDDIRRSDQVVKDRLGFGKEMSWGEQMKGVGASMLPGRIDKDMSMGPEGTMAGHTHIGRTMSAMSFGGKSQFLDHKGFGKDLDREESEHDMRSARQSSAFADKKQSQQKKTAVVELSDAELNAQVSIVLEETETIWMLDIPGTYVDQDSDEAVQVIKDNEIFEQQLARKEALPDGFPSRCAQTLHFAEKTKGVQTNTLVSVETGSQASEVDMFDTRDLVTKEALLSEEKNMDLATKSTSLLLNKSSVEAKLRAASLRALSRLVNKKRNERADSARSSRPPSSSTALSLASEAAAIKEKVRKEPPEVQWANLKKGASILSSLQIMERLVVQPNYRDQQQLFLSSISSSQHAQQDAPNAPDAHPALKTLWKYSSARTVDKVVTCLSLNKKNPDIVAVGYRPPRSQAKGEGLVCVFSVKNPDASERSFVVQSPVSSIDFSKAHPHLLAVGCEDGSIFVFDVHEGNNKPIMDTITVDIAGKHSQPVWDLRWVERESVSGQGRTEYLISVAGDGRVLQWATSKGLESTELMKVKRAVAPPQPSGSATDAATSKTNPLALYSPVLSCAFSPTNSSVYYVGTEDGSVHECSCSYNEQYMGSYVAHTGPVYSLAFSPHDDELFATASEDWSISVWSHGKSTPLARLTHHTQPIRQAVFSPHSPTTLASISSNTLCVWDLGVKDQDPIIALNMAASLSCVAFAKTTNALLTGDENGDVLVTMLDNLPKAATQLSLRQLLTA